MPAVRTVLTSSSCLVLVVNTVAPESNVEVGQNKNPNLVGVVSPARLNKLVFCLQLDKGRADPVRELGIPDSAGITGKTLGRTVKLPTAVTELASLGGRRF